MMNNMYDILNKMNLLEGKSFKPDFPDIDNDGNRTEPIARAAREVDEASYSAKAARAGKDIGKPGKTFAKIAKSAGERYGSKERGEKVAGAVLAKLRAKESVEESEMDESALQAYLGKKKYGDAGMKALQKAGREGASKETMARIRAKHDKMDEAEMEEGNEFSGELAKARASGAKEFKVDGKSYKVTKEQDEKMMNEDVIEEGFVEFMDRKAAYRTIGADVEGKAEDYVVTFKDGTRKRYQETERGRRVTTLEPVERPDETDDEGNVVKRGRGRPKGTGRSIGTRGVTDVRAKKKTKEDVAEDYDKDEYDEEGEMAMSQARTIEDAAQELQSILDANENLPEWVQKKITLAKEYIDSARDYLKANRPEEEMMAEKAVSKAQRAAAGIAYAAKKGDIPKSELRGASKEMAKMASGELKKFAKTKEKGLPEKKKEESVEETTVAGSVATAPAETKKSKGGIQFGKGIYEGQIEESYNKKLSAVLTEGMTMNASVGEDGRKSLTVTATDDDAEQLAAILKMAGVGAGYKEACPSCGQSPCGCDQIDEELANAPDEEYADTDTMVNKLSGGLNARKTTGQTTGAPFNRDPARMGVMHQSQVDEAQEKKLFDLYKQFKG